MASVPDRLYIDFNDRDLYEKVSAKLGLFKGKNRKEQFLFAMAFGFANETRIPLKTRENFFLRKDMKMEDETLVNAVALYHEDDVDLLSDKNQVYRVAEEYAHAGIKLLADRIASVEFGSFWKQFEKELCEAHEKLMSKDGLNEKQSSSS